MEAEGAMLLVGVEGSTRGSGSGVGQWSAIHDVKLGLTDMKRREVTGRIYSLSSPIKVDSVCIRRGT